MERRNKKRMGINGENDRRRREEARKDVSGKNRDEKKEREEEAIENEGK